MKYKVIISGGGTGGHIFPAIAIANQIKEQMPESEILFVGALGRMEMEKVPAAGYRIVGLPVAGLQRKALHKNFSLPCKLFKSIRLAKKIIRDFQPDVAVGVGGYASGPLLWVASRSGVPCLIQEQNSYPGVTNKLLAKRVQTICVAYPDMERFFPKEKICFTGNPVRSSIVPVNERLRKEGREYFGIEPDRKCLLILGGSLGARKLNDCVMKWALDKETVSLIWQCGAYYRREVEAFVAEHPHPDIHLHPFINRMDLAYAAADVVISRSGAGTISELCIAGKAVIFVPSPNVSEDHQTKNAMALVSKNGALMVSEEEADGRLMRVAVELVEDNERRERLAVDIRAFARKYADKDIVHEIMKLIKK